MNQNSRLVLKNGLLLTLAPFLPKAVSVVILPIITRYLTAEDYGIAATIGAYSNSIGAFMTLGLTIVLMNSFFRHPLHYKMLWRQIYGFLKLWMIVYALLQAVLLYIFIPPEAEANRWWIIILTNFSTVFFGPTGTIGSSYCIYSKQSVPVVWRSVAASLITIATNFLFIVGFKWGYMGWYVGTFTGTFFTNASYWYMVNRKLGLRPIYRFRWKTILHALNVGVPTIPHYYTSYLLEGSGKMVLDRYHVDRGEIGQLSISQQLGDMMQTAMKGMNEALSPFMIEAMKSGNKPVLKKIALLSTGLIFALAFVASLWSKEIFALLLSNEALEQSYPLFIVYIMALCYRPLYYFTSAHFMYYEHTKQLLLVTFVSGCIALALYIVLTPLIGLWAFLLGHYAACLYYGYSGFLYSGYRKHSIVKLPVIGILILQLLLTVLAYVLVDYLWAKIAITVLIAAAAAFMYPKYSHLFRSKKTTNKTAR